MRIQINDVAFKLWTVPRKWTRTVPGRAWTSGSTGRLAFTTRRDAGPRKDGCVEDTSPLRTVSPLSPTVRFIGQPVDGGPAAACASSLEFSLQSARSFAPATKTAVTRNPTASCMPEKSLLPGTLPAFGSASLLHSHALTSAVPLQIWLSHTMPFWWDRSWRSARPRLASPPTESADVR
jgi:hypothetical protein